MREGDKKPYTNVLFLNGGMGATADKDGEHVLSWPSNISSTPVEVAERNGPLFFHYKRLRPDSTGAGRFRGGLGQDILMESESATPIVVSSMAERTKFPAPGLAGGGAGGLGDVRINGRSVEQPRPACPRARRPRPDPDAGRRRVRSGRGARSRSRHARPDARLREKGRRAGPERRADGARAYLPVSGVKSCS